MFGSHLCPSFVCLFFPESEVRASCFLCWCRPCAVDLPVSFDFTASSFLVFAFNLGPGVRSGFCFRSFFSFLPGFTCSDFFRRQKFPVRKSDFRSSSSPRPSFLLSTGLRAECFFFPLQSPKCSQIFFCSGSWLAPRLSFQPVPRFTRFRGCRLISSTHRSAPVRRSVFSSDFFFCGADALLSIALSFFLPCTGFPTLLSSVFAPAVVFWIPSQFLALAPMVSVRSSVLHCSTPVHSVHAFGVDSGCRCRNRYYS
jgi:hypothetical protein